MFLLFRFSGRKNLCRPLVSKVPFLLPRVTHSSIATFIQPHFIDVKITNVSKQKVKFYKNKLIYDIS